MFKRYELHNHTTHSDANITCRELVEHMEKDHVDVVALTDHNTISGHREMQQILSELNTHVQGIYGMEYTTYYGHILCQNLHRYVSWDSIDLNHPEKLFEECRKAGALTGVAHPFSFGAPFARGCRFEMKIHDFTNVDYIEIFNDLESLHNTNEPALRWWEELCLQGERIAATCGMDLHGPWNMSMQFATYLEGETDGDPAKELEQAILNTRTWVSKGMLLCFEPDGAGWRFTLEDVHKPGFKAGEKWVMTLRGAEAEKAYELPQTGIWLGEDEMPAGPVLIAKLFCDLPVLENLICVSPVLRRDNMP